MKSRLFLYIPYTMAAIAVCLYIRFPSAALRDYTTRRAENLLPGLTLAIADIRPSLPAAICFQDIEASYRKMSMLEFEQVRLAPEWGSLLKLDPVGVFKTRIAGGSLQGKIHPPGGMGLKNAISRIDFEKLQLAKLPILSELFGRRIAGECSGTISRISGSAPQDMQLRLQLDNAAVELRQPLLPRDKVSIKRLQADAALVDGSNLKITQCEFRGPEFDGDLTGSVSLKEDFGNSSIRFEGTVRPHTVLMAELKKIVPAQLMRGKEAGGSFSFQLSGTLAKPQYSFR